MTIQLFYSADAFTSFPSIEETATQSTQTTLLSKLFWSDGAQMMIALFEENQDLNDTIGAFGKKATLQKVWRDGTLVEVQPEVPKSPFDMPNTNNVVPTNDGRVARTIHYEDYAGAFGDYWSPLLNEEAHGSLTGTAYFEVNPLWPGDLLPNARLAEASHMHADYKEVPRNFALELSGGNGMILPTQSAVYAAFTNHNNVFPITLHVILIDDTQSTICLSLVDTGGADIYTQQFRQLIPIDASSVIALFRPQGGVEPNENLPAQIRIYDTTSQPWTELWRDLLPGTDQVATYDPKNKILYSCGKRSTNAAMHASLLLRTPTVTSASIIGDETKLPGPGSIQLSALVVDDQNLPISNELVRWTLVSQIDQGELTSNYSLTNVLGQASITYAGPYLESNLTETVITTVAQVRKA